MDELSSIGRKLIDAAMDKDEPPPADESWGTLVTRLTEEAPRAELPIDARPRQEPQRRSAIWIAIAVAVITGVAFWWWWTPPREAAPVAVEKHEPPATVPPSTKSAPAKKAAPEQPPVEQLITEAEAALAAGDPDRAMALLERHAERAAIHPQAPQRMALRILVLCAQDQHDRARDEARAFLAAHPKSEWSDEVRRSCAGS